MSEVTVKEGEVRMANTVLMFPGVGSHYSGMGTYFFDNFQAVRDVFAEASEALGQDMAALCMDKSQKSELDRLENSQTALVTVSVATYRVFQQEIGLQPDAMLGYSLGEYSALCCAGALELGDALRLVKARGEIVSAHAASVDGTMAWITNLAPEIVEEICAGVSAQGEPVYVSAYDTPLKTSISGTTAAIRLAGEEAVKRGGIAIPIRMSGPFHSPIMQPAAEKFRALLQDVRMTAPAVPVIANRNARPYGAGESVADNLYQQLVQPVRWLDSMNHLLESGMTTAVELGPKNVLQYLLLAIAPDVLSCTYDKEKDVRKTERALLVQPEDFPEIIARCLAVVAGTKNRNRDASDYERRVVRPFQAVQTAFEERRAVGQPAEEAHLQEALQMLQTALEAKRLRPEDRERQLREALGGKRLKIQA